jgi:hypothetical protein
MSRWIDNNILLLFQSVRQWHIFHTRLYTENSGHLLVENRTEIDVTTSFTSPESAQHFMLALGILPAESFSAIINGLASTRFLSKATIMKGAQKTMRRKNWRIVIVGFVLTVIALGFYFFMLSIASKSTDPTALMQTVGTVAGAAVGISFIMIIFGLIGKKI